MLSKRAVHSARVRIAAPRMPAPPTPHRFPVFAAFAPVLASLAMWAVTRSPLALAFAALGPVIAIATTADSRLQERRQRKRDAVAFTADCDRARVSITRAHVEERHTLERAYPAVRDLLAGLEHNPLRWSAEGDSELLVRIGSGPVPSSIDYEDSAAAHGADPDARLLELRALASRVPNAAIVVDARLGIGFVGPSHFALAAARGIRVQLSVLISPAFSPTIPHLARVETAATLAALPREIGIGIEIDATGGGALVRAPDPSQLGPLEVEFVSAEAASAAEALLRECAEREGVRAPGGTLLPEMVELARLPRDDSASCLRCSIGMGGSGPVWLDLVADGPHAIVGGTTGSGKSELLLSWVIAMARERGPDAVTFLFVDFKGGAAFDPLRRLRHCVGIITDLDAGESLRALSSLAAELRHRERELALRGLRSIDDAEGGLPFPRLVVIVDEYAALVETHSVLHTVFADIASRGRSLGVHLVLCTQRPSGVVRDSILANCALRLSLRVNSAADSTAVIGTDAAAVLPRRPLGRALLSAAGEPPELLQVARSSSEDVGAVIERWRDVPMPRAPWLPPLDHVIPMDIVAGEPRASTVPFALVDRPDEQRRETARYDPVAHGSMLVVGAGGSGKSGVLDALATAPTVFDRARVAAGSPALWDALAAALEAGTRHPRLLLIDDVDAVIASSPEEYQGALTDLLTRVLREGPSLGVHAVLTVQRISGALGSVAALCGSRLVLRTSNRQEHLLAGGETGEFVSELPPGGGHWRGHRIQVLAATASTAMWPAPAPRAVELDLAASKPLAVISSRPQQFARTVQLIAPGRRISLLADRLPGTGDLEVSAGGARGGLPAILVADPECWQANWILLADLRRRCDLLIDGCSLSDIRALTRVRELPPPFPRGERPLWLLDVDHELHRARLRGGASAMPEQTPP
ncbi:MAG: segregation ATPase FtsK/SpoIIIE, family [Actinomycetota bacterium]|nr:segregation ATPase FtsK/SpoIIIE, family [Actinomycetota bacterium]